MKITQGKTKRIFNKYHKDIWNRIDGIRQEIETTILNRTMREWQNFDYQTFCTHFENKLDHHYSKIEKYKVKWNLFRLNFLF